MAVFACTGMDVQPADCYVASSVQAGAVHMAVNRAFFIGIKSYSQIYAAAFGLETGQP